MALQTSQHSIQLFNGLGSETARKCDRKLRLGLGLQQTLFPHSIECGLIEAVLVELFHLSIGGFPHSIECGLIEAKGG